MSRLGGTPGVALAACVLLLAGCAEFWADLYRPPMGPVGKKHTPVLEAAWAAPEVENGTLWKIYLRARDPDGDLDKVAIGFSQPGALWVPQYLIVREPHRRRLSGAVLFFAQLQGGGSGSTVYASAKVLVEDRAGNVSSSKTLEFTLVPYGTGETKAKPPKDYDDKTVFGQMDFPLLTERAIQGSGD